MVPRPQFVAMGLIFVGLFLFYFTYYHYMYLQADELTFAQALADILTKLNPAPSDAEYGWVNGFALTEEWAHRFWFSFSFALLFVALCVTVIQRRQSGPSRLFVPMVFAIITVVGAELKVAYEIGLLPGT